MIVGCVGVTWLPVVSSLGTTSLRATRPGVAARLPITPRLAMTARLRVATSLGITNRLGIAPVLGIAPALGIAPPLGVPPWPAVAGMTAITGWIGAAGGHVVVLFAALAQASPGLRARRARRPRRIPVGRGERIGPDRAELLQPVLGRKVVRLLAIIAPPAHPYLHTDHVQTASTPNATETRSAPACPTGQGSHAREECRNRKPRRPAAARQAPVTGRNSHAFDRPVDRSVLPQLGAISALPPW